WALPSGGTRAPAGPLTGSLTGSSQPRADRPRRGLPRPSPHGRGWRDPYEGKITVSIDPSSIPSFGGQPEPQPQGPAGPVVPEQDRVKQLPDQMALEDVVHDGGDLAGPTGRMRA